jgi:hypothetical protein
LGHLKILGAKVLKDGLQVVAVQNVATQKSQKFCRRFVALKQTQRQLPFLIPGVVVIILKNIFAEKVAIFTQVIFRKK